MLRSKDPLEVLESIASETFTHPVDLRDGHFGLFGAGMPARFSGMTRAYRVAWNEAVPHCSWHNLTATFVNVLPFCVDQCTVTGRHHPNIFCTSRKL